MLTRNLLECTKQTGGFFQVSKEDSSEMDTRVKKAGKASMEALRLFMQFKTELSAVNEPVLSKDLSSLSSNIVTQ